MKEKSNLLMPNQNISNGMDLQTHLTNQNMIYLGAYDTMFDTIVLWQLHFDYYLELD